MCNKCRMDRNIFEAKQEILSYYLDDEMTAYEIACIMAINPSTVASIIEENVL